jgi:hypothetical protein
VVLVPGDCSLVKYLLCKTFDLVICSFEDLWFQASAMLAIDTRRKQA